ncbi:MAG: TetR/AcrR family transcriptional regulator [Pseudomonadota bacterium]
MAQDRRSELMDHAERAVRARGYDGFSYADLADAVGIKKASIHYHFPAKADLARALMDRYREKMECACAAIDDAGGSAATRAAALIEVYRAATRDGTSLCLCVAFIGSRESLSPPVIAEISRYRAGMRAWITAVFARAKTDGSIAALSESGSEAAATLALLEGAQLAARAEARSEAFDEALESLQARL